MSLQFPTITSFIGTVEGHHSKTEYERLGPKETFHLPGLYDFVRLPLPSRYNFVPYVTDRCRFRAKVTQRYAKKVSCLFF